MAAKAKNKTTEDIYFQGYAHHADLYITDDENYICKKLTLEDMLVLRRQLTDQIIKMKLNNDTTVKRRL